MMHLPSPRRVLFVVGAILALAGSTHAAPTRATVVIGGKPVPFIVSPYVGESGQVFAPVDAVSLLGAQFTPDTDAHTVTVTGPAGKSITVPYDLVQGRYCIPLQKVVQALGASTDWQPTTQTLTVRARLLMVRQDDNALSIYTSYPVYYRVQRLNKPNRLFVDLYGLDLAAQAAAIPIQGGDVLHIRSGQMGYNTVRIVIDLKRNVAFKVESPLATNRVQVALGVSGSLPSGGNGLSPMPVQPMPVTPPHVATRPTPVLPVVPPSEGVHITDVSLKTVGSLTQILVTATGPAKYSTELLDNPHRLAFDLAGATLDTAQRQLAAPASPVMKQVRWGVFKNGDNQFGRVVVDLQHLVPFTVTQQTGPDGGVIYAINLQGTHPTLPNLPILGGSLAGKIVVVDPGHGHQDSGALGLHGEYEKDVALSIGLKLREALRRNGAVVYMTRDDDGFMSVDDRPRFAIAHNADFFISVHCDYAGPPGPVVPTSHSGTIVYFHAWNPICRRLAADISARVGEVSGLPEDGTKSDMRSYGGRFETGYGVLKGSPMPAVLVECGYMNNPSDIVKLIDADTQQRIAGGIVAGVRDFLGGRTASR